MASIKLNRRNNSSQSKQRGTIFKNFRKRCYSGFGIVKLGLLAIIAFLATLTSYICTILSYLDTLGEVKNKLIKEFHYICSKKEVY